MTANEPGKIIDELWIFVAQDTDGEGVVGASVGSNMVPLIAADRERVEFLRPLAQRIATQRRCRIEIRHLTHVTDVEVLDPQ